ncbi:T9SS type A sorting domain-containing protein [Ochrovirga pacifica]|uniref:T9SS type A sorting domain-containing protein n=1 Tax=Ochrovirga pacifica TaxID=1042376 RepID=UPI000255A2C6|nr:T9SS type A sorting domain-containing protein [Ochrovirga pacifica]
MNKISLSLLLIFWFAYVSVNAQNIVLPVEVLGQEGVVKERQFYLSNQQVSLVNKVWFQINNLSYQNKGSIQINNEDWISLNHTNCAILSPEKERGGMVHGGHNTIRFTIPAEGLLEGVNNIKFRFDLSDGISNGYRVVRFNLLDVNKNDILEESVFEEDDPELWTDPYTEDGEALTINQLKDSVSKGKSLWYYGRGGDFETKKMGQDLWSNYLPSTRDGFWYGHNLGKRKTISAKCASCHTQDGRDLEIFSYSNESIIQRSEFHSLTKEEGKLIAAYIRSLSNSDGNTTGGKIHRYGRPWNPPYQPGQQLKDKPIEQWSAGAGLDAVLEKDADMLEHMFPNGVNQEEVYKRFDSKKMYDRTLIPLAIQFPDWKHWLPIIHPMDAYTKNDFWNNPFASVTKRTLKAFDRFPRDEDFFNPKKGYEDYRDYLENNFSKSAKTLDDYQLLHKWNQLFHHHYRGFLVQGTASDEFPHWRTSDGEATKSLGEGVPRELAGTSLARLMAVQFFELYNEFDLQDKAKKFMRPDQVDGYKPNPNNRQWFGKDYQVFEVPPHFQACVKDTYTPEGEKIIGNCQFFHGQPEEVGQFESTNWYHLQLVLNGGEGGFVQGNGPTDYNYHPDFIMKASSSSGIYEPLRYYHSMNAKYQIRDWEDAGGPNNDSKGFRIRVQGPWHIIGRSDSHQLNKIPENAWPKFLDKIQPGLSVWILNAQLKQFLEAVNSPVNSIEKFERSENGSSDGLDAVSKKTSDLKTDMDTFVGLDYWADKMYYLIPQFIDLGVDCNIIEDLISWSKKAWPNIDFEKYRNTTELKLLIDLEDQSECNTNQNVLIAQTTGDVENLKYEWWIDDQEIENNTNKLSTENINTGARVKCRVTLKDAVCTLNNWAENNFILPSEGLNIKMKKNAGEWLDFKNNIACLDDVFELKLEASTQPLLWLDATKVKETNEPTNRSFVNHWYNKANNGYAIPVLTNNNLRPRYDNEGLNGLPAVVFGERNADGLELFSTSNDEFLNNDWTMIVTGKGYRVSNKWGDLMGNFTNNKGFGFKFSKDGRSQTVYNDEKHYGKYFKDGNNFIITTVKKGDRVQVFINGKLEEDFKIDNTNMRTSRAFYLGQISGGNANANWYHKGPISEVLVFDYSIPKNHQTYLEGYLAHKWRMSQELPLEHVYKKHSPLDISLEQPDGTTVLLNNNNLNHTIKLDESNKFGKFTFSKLACSDTVSKIVSISNSQNMEENFIKYRIDNGIFNTSDEIILDTETQITLKPNYILEGRYQWETPRGDKLAYNKDPEIFSIIDEDSDYLGEWKLHILTDPNCLTNPQVFSLQIKYNKDLSTPEVEGTEISIQNNPFGNVLKINGMTDETYQFVIYDMYGKVHIDKEIKKSSSQIDMSSFNSGVYLLRIQDDNSTVVFKIIKE